MLPVSVFLKFEIKENKKLEFITFLGNLLHFTARFSYMYIFPSGNTVHERLHLQ